MSPPAADLATAVALARPIVEHIVWCATATAGPEGPRSRIMHPVWAWDARPVAVATSRPTALKRRHLDHVPLVSCTWWDGSHDTVTIDALAAWVADEERAHAWDLVRAAPPPVGFDPAMIWPDGPESPGCAFLRLTAVRITVAPGGVPAARWHEGAPAIGSGPSRVSPDG